MSKVIFFRNSHKADSPPEESILMEGLAQQKLDTYEEVQYSDVVALLKGQEISCFYDSNGNLVPLEPDLAWLRGLSDADTRQFLAKYLDSKHIETINSENKFNMPTSKLNQYYLFATNNVPYPLTVCSHPRLFVQAFELAKFEFPVIVKDVAGRMGLDNYLVNNIDELRELSGKVDELRMFAMQPFIPNDGDYRIIVFKDEILMCYKRARANTETDHRNNVSQGGERILIPDIPEQHRDIAIGAAKALKRELTGIDVLVGPQGEPYVLESNFKFGMKDTGDDVFRLVVERLAPILHKLADPTDV